MKAVVMAGGEGTRLRPMTSDLPKPLLPVADRPIMEHVLRLLADHGIDESVVTVQYLADRIRERFGDGSELGMSLTYVKEESPLGTAGSVKNAEEHLRGDPFVVISGDALTDIDLTRLITHHRSRKALVTVCLSRVSNPLEFGITVLDDDGRVRRFLEKPTWGQVFSDTVNTGIYVMEPEVLDYVPAGEPVDWSGDVFPRLLAEGRPVHGWVADGYWEDVGTHTSYLKAQADVLERRVAAGLDGFEQAPGVVVAPTAHIDPTAVLEGPLYIGPYAQIGAGARLEADTVVGGHAVVDRGALLQRAVVHSHAYVGPHAVVRGGVIGTRNTLHRRVRVEEGAVLGAGCTVEEDATIAGDVLVYPGKRVEAGTTVRDSLLWDSRGTGRLFGPGGVSGQFNVGLTPELAVRLAGAFAGTLPAGAGVALGRDHAPASQVLAAAVGAALRATGSGVRDLGHVPLPLLREAAAEAAGGVFVRTTPGRPDSADIRFLDARGSELSPVAQRKLERVFDRGEYRRGLAGDTGGLDRTAAPVASYAERLAGRLYGRHPDDRRLKVIVDAAGGSTSLVLPAVLGRLGVEALTVNSRLDPGHCTEAMTERSGALRALGALVTDAGADFGVRFDASGERISVVDDRGRPVSEDRTLLLLIELVTAESGGGLVSLPVTASRTAEVAAARHRALVVRTATAPGELSRAVADNGSVLAGDGEGAFILPEFSPHPDAVAAFIRLAGLVARSGSPVSALVARLPRPHVRQRELPTAWRDKGLLMRSVVRAAGDRQIDTTDGVRVVEPDGRWTLVLPDAGTPVTRLWAEGPDTEAADALLDEWTETVSNIAA